MDAFNSDVDISLSHSTNCLRLTHRLQSLLDSISLPCALLSKKLELMYLNRAFYEVVTANGGTAIAGQRLRLLNLTWGRWKKLCATLVQPHALGYLRLQAGYDGLLLLKAQQVKDDVVQVKLLDPRRNACASAEAVSSLYNLTLAENKLLQVLLKGYNLKQAATQLNLSYSTLRTHLQHIRLKTGCHSLTQLMILSLRLLD